MTITIRNIIKKHFSGTKNIKIKEINVVVDSYRETTRNSVSVVINTIINDGLSIVTKTGEKKEAVYDFKFVCDSKTINERNGKKRNPVSFEELYRVNLPIINSVFRG